MNSLKAFLNHIPKNTDSVQNANTRDWTICIFIVVHDGGYFVHLIHGTCLGGYHWPEKTLTQNLKYDIPYQETNRGGSAMRNVEDFTSFVEKIVFLPSELTKLRKPSLLRAGSRRSKVKRCTNFF